MNQKYLEECKIRYPIGTRYKCAIGNTDETHYNKKNKSINGVFTVLGHDYHTGLGVFGKNNGWLYYKDKWAEIISLPEGYIKEQLNYYFY
jgi:hypothetical protein